MANDHVVTESENSSAISAKFECNICLDTVHDPVVTLCGHLYCWPCIYKWFRYKQQPSSSQNLEDETTNCPVCKTDITEKDIVPLYGPASLTANLATKNNGLNDEEMVPPRPPSTPRYRSRGGYHRLAPRPITLPGRGETSVENVVVLSPMIGMLGEMVSGRILGDLDAPLFGTPNSYNQVAISRRDRLQTTQADRSLSRVCSFLICCLLFCLVVFT